MLCMGELCTSSKVGGYPGRGGAFASPSSSLNALGLSRKFGDFDNFKGIEVPPRGGMQGFKPMFGTHNVDSPIKWLSSLVVLDLQGIRANVN